MDEATRQGTSVQIKRTWRTRPTGSDARQHRGRVLFRLAPLILLTVVCGCARHRQNVGGLPLRHSVQTDQLLVLSDFQLSSNHPLFLDLLELQKELTQTLQLPKQGRQVVVYLFDNEQRYRKFLATAYPNLPPRRAYFVGTPHELAVFTFWGDRIQEDIRHEFTHGLLHSRLRNVPLWLDEGLAEYFEVAGHRAGRVNLEYARWLSSSIANGWRPDLQRLEKLYDISHMQRNDYQEAWGWVHYLLHGSPESRAVLLGYLSELCDNPHPSLSFETKLAQVIPGFRDRYISYVASLPMGGSNWTASAGPNVIRVR